MLTRIPPRGTEEAQLLVLAEHVLGPQRQFGDLVESPDVESVGGVLNGRGVENLVGLGHDAHGSFSRGESPGSSS